MIKFIKKYFRIKKLQYFKISAYRYVNLNEVRSIAYVIEYDKQLFYTPILIIKFRKNNLKEYYLGFYLSSSFESAIEKANSIEGTIMLQQWRYYKAKYYD